MRIAYLFMRYPLASQPFALSDVKALESLGHHVEAYALSGRDRRHRKLVREHNLRLGLRSHPSWRTIASLVRPANLRIVSALLNLLWSARGNTLGQTLKALALVPRVVEVTSELRRTRPDVVHAFWGHYPSLVLALAAKFAPECRLSLFLGAYDLTSHFVTYTRSTLPVVHDIWTHSEANVPTLLALGVDPRKIHVVHRGVPLELADGEMPPKEPYRICTAAHLQREKNIDRVLHVFRRVRESIPQARLIVAGDGAERNALEALARDLGVEDSVTFTGALPREVLFREMAKAQVFLFLSTKVSERLPNVVKEAMLAGCHCIVSGTPGIGELVHQGVTGEILQDEDVAGTAARVIDALEHWDGEMGRAASSFIRENMSSRVAMQAHVRTWRCRPPSADGYCVPVS